MNFSTRSREKELMDNPNLEKALLAPVFKDIDRANRLLGGNRIIIKTIGRILKEYPHRELSILDVGCGAGAMLRVLAAFCRKKGHKIRLIGIDLNQQALSIAREQSKDYPEISYLNQDILSLKEDLNCDILLCTLTMHHFSDDEIAVFLKKFIAISKIGVIINDLQRSKWAYIFFRVFSAIFIRSKIAKHDGLVSIKSGFILKELKALSASLPGVQHTIKPQWAFRYAWVMRKDESK
ncbi:MAG: methyltransferase domain-containing protein [Flavobacteriaceae bacterium]